MVFCRKGVHSLHITCVFLTQKLFERGPRTFATEDFASRSMPFRIEQLYFRDFQLNWGFSSCVLCHCGTRESGIKNSTKQKSTRSKALGNDAEFSAAWGLTMPEKSPKEPRRENRLCAWVCRTYCTRDPTRGHQHHEAWFRKLLWYLRLSAYRCRQKVRPREVNWLIRSHTACRLLKQNKAFSLTDLKWST